MGNCVVRDTSGKQKCDVCSKGLGQKGRKHFIICSNGHSVCQVCIVKSGEQLLCPHCKTQVISIKAVEIRKQYEEFMQNKPNFTSVRSERVESIRQSFIEPKETKRVRQIPDEKAKAEEFSNYQSHLDQGFSRIGDIQVGTIKQQDHADQIILAQLPPPKPILPQQVAQQIIPVSSKADETKENEKIIQQPKQKQQKKTGGCSAQGVLLFIVLIFQCLLIALNLFYSYYQPRSQCMDVAHYLPFLALRPLVLQVSGVEAVLTLLISLSAFIYVMGCFNQAIFDKWLTLLKAILGLKQLVWAAIQIFLQVVIMPNYCSPEVMRFVLISSVTNGVSFLLIIIKPLYSCLCSKSS